MKLNENYLNPGPLTDSGFSRLSHYQASLPESDQAPVGPPVNGQTRLMAISGERSPGIEGRLAYDSSPGGLERETYTWNPGSMNLYPDFNPSGFLNRCCLTEFLWRTSSLETGLVKTELVLLYTELINRYSRDGIVEMLPHSTSKRHRRRICKLSSLIVETASMGNSIDKTFVLWQQPLDPIQLHHLLKRWHRTSGLNRRNPSLIKQELYCGVKGSLSKSSKLIFC